MVTKMNAYLKILPFIILGLLLCAPRMAAALPVCDEIALDLYETY